MQRNQMAVLHQTLHENLVPKALPASCTHVVLTMPITLIWSHYLHNIVRAPQFQFQEHTNIVVWTNRCRVLTKWLLSVGINTRYRQCPTIVVSYHALIWSCSSSTTYTSSTPYHTSMREMRDCPPRPIIRIKWSSSLCSSGLTLRKA